MTDLYTCTFVLDCRSNTYSIFVFQIIDLGVILHPGSYLREFWNVMDAVVVICAFMSFIFQKG